MAASWLIVALRVEGDSAVDLARSVFPGTVGNLGKQYSRQVASAIGRIIGSAGAGQMTSNLYASVIDDAGTKSSGTIACVQANATGDNVTFTYGGKAIVLTEGTAGENGFARGADNTACALNLATCINAHSVLKGLFLAAPTAGNCLITAKCPTVLLNSIAISTNDATAFTVPATVAGSTVGTAQWFFQHFALNRTP